MGLHDLLLMLHSALRWVVLVGGVFVIGRSIARRGKEWTDADSAILRGFVGAFDAQVALGLIMYFSTSALGLRMLVQAADIAMKDSRLRFFAIEHITGMVIAAAVIHIGSVRARKLGTDPSRHGKTARFLGIGFFIVLASIPWWFFPYARPLLRR